MPMTKVTATVEVNAPLDDVWAFASDWRHWDSWWDGVSGFRPTTEVTRGDGARYAYRAWIAGLTLNLETEIHDFVEKVGWRGVVTKGPPHRTQWVFEGKGATTQLTYTLEYSLPVPVLGPLLDSLLMRPGWQHRLETSLRNLKRHFDVRSERGQDGRVLSGA
jgi:uncharacterized membrane protein